MSEVDHLNLTNIQYQQIEQNLQDVTSTSIQPIFYGLVFMAGLAIGGMLTKYFVRER